MANEFTDAFTELQQCFEDETGATQQVIVNGTPCDCIVSELTRDEMLCHGGVGEAGGFSVMVPASAFGVLPQKVQSIQYGSLTLSVLSFKQVNSATIEIIAGSFTMNP